MNRKLETLEKLEGDAEINDLNKYGGLSGSGIFRINDKDSLLPLEPIGILYEGSDKFHINFGSHIKFIKRNGLIQKQINSVS